MARTPLEPRDRRTTHVRPATERSAGARAATTDQHRRRRPAWLWWLLGLLALLAAAAILASTLGGDDDSADRSTGQTQQQNGDTGTGTADGQGTGAAGATADDAANAGRLTAGGASLLPAPSGGLSNYVGQNAQGTDLRVLTVVSNAEDPNALEGFWVGTSDQDRTYVEWGGDVGADEADYRPTEGETVNLAGPIRPAPENPAQTLNLNDADAAIVQSQGGYVNADTVTPAEG